MKIKGRVNYFFPVEFDVTDNGLDNPQMLDGIMYRHFFWLFHIISWLKALAWWRNGIDPMFEISISKKEWDKFNSTP